MLKRLVVLGIALTLAISTMGTPADAGKRRRTAVRGGGVISVLKCKGGEVKQVDPIVNPNGGRSSHMHQFFAGKGIQPVGTPTTEADMRNGGTTCPLDADTAGYWTPTLVNSRTGAVVEPQQMNAYYRSPKGKFVRAFPPGFEAVCGNTTSRGDAPCLDTESQNTVGWGCTDSESFRTISAALPCPDKLIAHVQFKFPAELQLPKVSLHFRWKVTSGSYHLSSDGMGMGDNGASLHADFWNTWHQPTLEYLVNRCLNGGLKTACKGMTNAKLANLRSR